MTWHQWQEHFNALFGAGDWTDGSVVAWIKDVFIPGGMTPAEMDAAALAVARSGPPSRPHDVLRALLDEARRARVSDLMAREDQERRGGLDVTPLAECGLCGGTGLCTVPHHPQPEAAVAGNYLATHAVSCKCSAGLRMAQVCHDHHDEAILSLARYERDNPDWQEQVCWWTHHDKCAGNVGAKADEWAGLVDRLTKASKRRERR